jgi:hypothetical protein
MSVGIGEAEDRRHRSSATVGEVRPQPSHDEDGVQAGDDLGGVAAFSKGAGAVVTGPPPLLCLTSL